MGMGMPSIQRMTLRNIFILPLMIVWVRTSGEGIGSAAGDFR